MEFCNETLELAKKAENRAKIFFERMDEVCAFNEAKVLEAFNKLRVSESDLHGSTGYGYGDAGRDKLDQVYAQAFGCEKALVRHHFVSGTHTLSTALFGVLRPGDTMVCLTGTPYDTMTEVIGINGEDGQGSLKDFGINYAQLDLLSDGSVNYDDIKDAVKGKKVAYIQRSRGYSLRESLTVNEIEKIIELARQGNKDIIVIVDNCYGEFVEKKEPSTADLIVGSLIKNPGGGIARAGGYIAGKSKYVDLCANRLTCVGVGAEEGCSLSQNREMYMGFFFAPSVVCNAVKTSIFALSLFDMMGYEVFPKYDAVRTDIIAAIKLNSEDKLVAFCKGIQQGSPIDSFAIPELSEMPGYQDKVVMAAGAFTNGASIELSADGPARQPYAVWLQGGLTYNTGKLGVLKAFEAIQKLK